MKLNRFVQRDKPSPLHSSGFVQRPDVIGSTAVDPFSNRLQRDRSRQTIGGYRDAQVLRQARYENRDQISTSRRDGRASLEGFDGPQLNSQRRDSRIDVVRPSGQGAPSSAPQRVTPQQHVFREPSSRHRS